MEIVNRIKEQLSFAAAAERRKDILLRNFRMDPKKVQSKYYFNQSRDF